jgi:CRISPR/Cas system-associated protein Csm6
MKNWTLILLLCFSAIYAKAPRDTVYVEQIIRDIVYIPIKPKTDTIYIQEMTATQTKKEEIENKKLTNLVK